mgnify:CR=1 FL=1
MLDESNSSMTALPPEIFKAYDVRGIVGKTLTPDIVRTIGRSIGSDLIERDAVVKADVFRSVAAAADTAPTTTNRLNLALALATPGHPSSNPAEAQRRLGELLSRDNALLPDERALALIVLKDVEQRLLLDAEAARLQKAAQSATTQRNDQNAQRLQTALDENRLLRQQLDEARAKLDAITNIERSIRERESGSNRK